MIEVSYVRKSKGTKNPHLSAIYKDENANDKSATFSVSGLEYDGPLEELRIALANAFDGKKFKDRASLLLTGWEEVIKFKKEREIPISLFEFGKSVPQGKAKFQGMSIGHFSSNKGLYLGTNVMLNGRAHATHISLGITSLTPEDEKSIIEEVIGMVISSEPADKVADARSNLAAILHDIVKDHGLTSAAMYEAATSGDKKSFISAVALSRGTNKGKRKKE